MASYRVLLLFAASCSAQWDPNTLPDRQVIVHLFEWKWSDVAAECEDFLGPKGFGGVQISPPNENVIVHNKYEQRPWWERYQPVSYKLVTRSGGLREFEDMVDRCNNAGVRIYPDAVINHMTSFAPDDATGTAGTEFDYKTENYPGVPYSSYDFNDANCNSASGGIESFDDPIQVRNCRLFGLADLNQGTEYVRSKIREYLNRLIEIGVAGFRVDAGKHMWPGDLQIIFGSLHNLSTKYFDANSRPFIYQEVIDNGHEKISSLEYVSVGRVTEFKYGMYLGRALKGHDNLKWLRNFGEDWGLLSRSDALVFVDNHDTQRGHGAGGHMILTFRNSRLYKMATAFMLGWPYGFTRVMSSYYWNQNWVDGSDKNDWVGPPHDGNYNILSPEFNADGSCSGDWVCEHRWRQIYNMVEFRNVAHGTDFNDWWDNGKNQIAFCRGDKGFVAINADSYDLGESLQTCLPAGTYCDVISGSLENGSCTGKSVEVGINGYGYISVKTTDYDGVLAIHINATLPQRK